MLREPDPSRGLPWGLRNQREGQGLVPHPGATLVTPTPFPLNALPTADLSSVLRVWPYKEPATEGRWPSIGQKKIGGWGGAGNRMLLSFLSGRGMQGKDLLGFGLGFGVFFRGREGVLL